MIKWFFLDGIHVDCTRIAVNQGVIAPTDVFPNLAVTPFALIHFTGMGTEVATNTTFPQLGEKWRKFATKKSLFQIERMCPRRSRDLKNGLHARTDKGTPPALF
jgi:hypothetical protein